MHNHSLQGLVLDACLSFTSLVLDLCQAGAAGLVLSLGPILGLSCWRSPGGGAGTRLADSAEHGQATWKAIAGSSCRVTPSIQVNAV